MKIIFSNGKSLILMGLTVKVSEEQSCDYDDYDDDNNADLWRIIKPNLNLQSGVCLPGGTITKPLVGELNGSWDIDEPFNDFKKGLRNGAPYYYFVPALHHRYSEAAARAVFNGNELARKADSDADVSYQLLGLLDLDEPFRSNFFVENGVNEISLRDTLVGLAPRHNRIGSFGRPYTEAQTKLSHRVWTEASQLNYEIIYPEHIILAILLCDDAVVRKAFETQDVSILHLADKLRERLRLLAPA